MPTYSFQMSAGLAGSSVSVTAVGSSAVVASGTLDTNALFTASLPVGDYVATAAGGHYSYRSAGTVTQSDPDQLSDLGLGLGVKGDLSEIARQAAPRPRPKLTLIGGGPDETLTSFANMTMTSDTTNYKLGNRAWKCTAASGTVAQVDVVLPATITPGPISTVGAWVYVEDATKVTAMTFYIYCVGGTWSRGVLGSTSSSHASKPLVTGWNLVRVSSFAGSEEFFATGITRARVVATINAPTSITVGHMWAETPTKASIIFVDDWGCKRFLVNGYPDLKSRGIPVTWALKTNKLGTGVAPDDLISWTDVATLSKENNNSISVHSYDGTATSTMTADQCAADYLKAVKDLAVHGYAAPLWRAAWVQNQAPNNASAFPYMVGSAMGNDSYLQISWPPVDRYLLNRKPIHGATSATMDTDFATLKATNGTIIFYTHGIDSVGGGNHSTPAEWAAWLARVDQGISEGWLECVTFDQLYARDGGRVRRTFGDQVAEFLDENGNPKTIRLP